MMTTTTSKYLWMPSSLALIFCVIHRQHRVLGRRGGQLRAPRQEALLAPDHHHPRRQLRLFLGLGQHTTQPHSLVDNIGWVFFNAANGAKSIGWSAAWMNHVRTSWNR